MEPRKDLAILHDDDEVFVRIGNQLNVCDWIAVDERQVGERSSSEALAQLLCEKSRLLDDGEAVALL